MIAISKIIEVIKVGLFVYKLAHDKELSNNDKIKNIVKELEEIYKEMKGK